MKNLKKFFFRLNSNYVWGVGMSEEEFAVFEKEAAEIIKLMGFNLLTKSSRNSCPQGILNEENIYAHSMDFSGFMTEENIEKMTNILNNFDSKTFSVRAIDIYELSNHHLEDIQNNLEKQKVFEAAQ